MASSSSSSEPDALLALRAAAQAAATILLQDADGAPMPSLAGATHAALGAGAPLPLGAPTRLRTPAGGAYALAAAVLAWSARAAPAAEYMRLAREAGLAGAFVSVTERTRLVEWLSGAAETHDGIVPIAAPSTTPPGSPPREPGSLAALTADAPAPAPAKRRYVPDADDAEVVKRIKQAEIELQDRNTVLRGTKPNVRMGACRNGHGER
jgi:parafibromin